MSVGRLTREGLPFSNVVATGTATNQITSGRTLENFQMRLGGTSLLKTHVSLFRMKANAKTIIEASGVELDKVNAYRGAGTTDPAFLDAFFSDYSMNNEFDRHVGAFDTSLVQNITTEVQIAGATAPTLKPILIESAAQKNAQTGEMLQFAPIIAKLLRYPYNIATGGKLPVNLPFGPQNGSIIKRIHIASNNNVVSGVTIKEDSLVVHESLKAENEFMQKRHGRVPQANWYTVDFVIDGDTRKAMDTRRSKSLEMLVDFTGADSGIVLVEYLDLLSNL